MKPTGRAFDRPRRQGRGIRVAVAVLATATLPLAVASRAWAQEARPRQDTLRFAEAVAAALEANPSLRAARATASSSWELVSQAGALPDPMVSLGLMNRPVDDFGTDHAMTMNQVQLTQRLPWPGVLSSSRRGAQDEARAADLDVEELERTLTTAVAAAYFEIAAIDRSLRVMEETRMLLRDFEQVSLARYTVGDGPQQDVLQAQVAVARMSAAIVVRTEDRRATVARMNALLARPAGAEVPALELPDPQGEPPALNILVERAAQARPALQAARARVRAAEQRVGAARAAQKPELSVMMGYGQRPRFDDLVSLGLGVSLPLWSGSKQRARTRELESTLGSREGAALNLENETFARLAELRAQAVRALELSELYETSILPQARTAVQSALASYRVGSVDYMALLANQITVNDFEIERIRLLAEYQRAVVEIEALTGPERGDQP